uniref:Uncharacterized protein n=1 Tax=viral metagenome TaxID=1070528 RepID=A0A6C0KEL3_9ZZZZ
MIDVLLILVFYSLIITLFEAKNQQIVRILESHLEYMKDINLRLLPKRDCDCEEACEDEQDVEDLDDDNECVASDTEEEENCSTCNKNDDECTCVNRYKELRTKKVQ